MDAADREKQIGARFRQARDNRNLSQAALAHQLRLTRDRVASIELGRVPLAWDVAEQFCQFLGVSQRWLATGEGEEFPAVFLPSEIPGSVTSYAFSHVYDTLLAPYCEAFFALRLDEVRRSLLGVRYARPEGQRGPGSRENEGAIFGKAVAEILSIALGTLPAPCYPWLYDRLRDLCIRFIDESGPAIAQSRNPAGLAQPQPLRGGLDSLEVRIVEASPKLKASEMDVMNSLTSENEDAIFASAMSKPITSWSDLRERLIKLTTERGAKAALARRFRVTPQAVGEWTHGKSMPSADMTLQLLPWVIEQESKSRNAEFAAGASSKKAR